MINRFKVSQSSSTTSSAVSGVSSALPSLRCASPSLASQSSSIRQPCSAHTSQLPQSVKTITSHPSRPSSTSSIPQIASPVNGKTCTISISSRNKNVNVNHNQTTNQFSLLDKIKLFRGNGSGNCGQQTVKDDNNKNTFKTTIVSKSDCSASVCGVESSHISVANNKSKPVVNVTKTSRNNNLNNNNNSNIISNNVNSLNQHKKCDEIINSDNKVNNLSNNNINSNNNNNINKSFATNSKPALIPLKRTGIPPPRSRPTSTIIDTPVNLSTMSSNCQSSSNTSLTAITKPTATVKGTSKISCDESTSRVGSSRKIEVVTSPQPSQLSQPPAPDATKITNIAHSQQLQQLQQLQPSNSKPEATIAMVSPIMSREHQIKLNSKKESTDDKNQVKSVDEQNDLNDQIISVNLKVDNKQTEQQQQQLQQQPDSASSSHGEESASNSDVDSALVNIKPMEPLVRTSQFAYLRNNPNSSSNSNSNSCDQTHNIASCSRFANNYSTIEKGYMSDCTLVNNGSRPATIRCAPVISGHNAGYLSESGVVCSPQIRKNQLPLSKYECVNTSHRHYHDADSAANITAIRAANLFHLMHTKHNNMINTHYPQFCLDDSSSLSSDPGMISGTEASGTTTTSSSTGDPIVHFLAKPNPKYMSSNSSKAAKATVKKTDSSMQTESVSALSSAAVWKKYLHEHHLMMKANHTVAPKIVASNDDSSKSLDRLDSRIPNGSQSPHQSSKKAANNTKIVERHDSCESLKHANHSTNKNANLKHDLLSNKRPLSSPISSRVAVTCTTYSGSATPTGKPQSGQRHNNKCKTLMTTGTQSQNDAAIHSDSEYMHHKQHQQQHNNLQNIINSRYALHLSPLRQRDTTGNIRLSSYSSIGANDNVGHCGLNKSNTISPWLQRHALTVQRDAITEAESMESLTAPSLDGNFCLSRHHSIKTASRPNSATIRLRDTASAASSAPNISSHNRSKEHSSQLMRNGSIRANKCSDVHTSATVFMSPNRDTHQQQCCLPAVNAVNNAQCKDEHQLHSSSLSLVSSSSLYSTAEDKNSEEMRKLRRELEHTNEKVSKKLSSNNSGWLRRSFTKAFKKNKSGSKRGSVSDAEIIGSKGSETEADSNSVPNSPLMSSRIYRDANASVAAGVGVGGVSACDYNETESVMDLRRQLREKEMILIDVRLDYLTSAYQLENLKETVNQMRIEMMNLKQDNDRLQRLLSSKSLASSQTSMISAHTGQHSGIVSSVATGDCGHNIENL